MLSEIEQNAKSIIFLNEQDHPYYAKIDEKKAVEDDEYEHETMQSLKTDEENFVILYLLWQPHMYHTQSAFQTMVELTVSRAMEHFGESLVLLSTEEGSPTSESTKKTKTNEETNASSNENEMTFRTKIHLVVDRISKKAGRNDEDTQVTDPKTNTNKSENEAKGSKISMTGQKTLQEEAEAHHAVEIKTVECLARSLAMSKTLRSVLDGITIGVTPEVRAAPALESVLKAIMFGGKERRRLVLQNRTKFMKGGYFQSKSGDLDNLIRSPIHVIAPSSDEMIGLDFTGETDAVQGIVQSVTFAEWNGNGDFKSFSRRSQDAWKIKCGLDAFDEKDNILNDTYMEDTSSAMVIAFLLCLFAVLWLRCGDFINEYVNLFR